MAFDTRLRLESSMAHFGLECYSSSFRISRGFANKSALLSELSRGYQQSRALLLSGHLTYINGVRQQSHVKGAGVTPGLHKTFHAALIFVLEYLLSSSYLDKERPQLQLASYTPSR
jgi:hypothetical protein